MYPVLLHFECIADHRNGEFRWNNAARDYLRLLCCGRGFRAFRRQSDTVVSFTGATLTISPTVLPHATQEKLQRGLIGIRRNRPIRFCSHSGTLPAGISLATDGTLSGIPTESGSFNFTVTVSDPDACGSQALTLVVDLSPCAAASLTISPSTVPNATINQNYTPVFDGFGRHGALHLHFEYRRAASRRIACIGRNAVRLPLPNRKF